MKGMRKGALVIVLLSMATHAAAQDSERLAPLLDGMGDYSFAITTTEPMAQRFFDQGLALAYAFNHAEAGRAFREAARLDPACAMCYWGAAYVLGPNNNATMEPEAAAPAFEALQQALARVDNASAREQAFIRALAARYEANPPEDRSALDLAYAEAMRAVAEGRPDDPDAATLYAEALMVTTPWEYWLEDGQPKEVTKIILAQLEGVMARYPEHPGANHFYIHAVEAVRPELGIAAADRLGDLVPGAGHLVHMPSHIYIRVGRYHDAATANERAIAADDAYVTQCHAQGLYPLAYMPHNHHFLWAAATLEGRTETALDAARHMAATQDPEMMRAPGLGTLQHYFITPLYALVRFGRWSEILEAEEPAADLVYPRGVWHYARGMALSALGRFDEAAAERAALAAIIEDPALDPITVWDINTTRDLLNIATAVLDGDVAARQGNQGAAIEHLRAGVAFEDALNYDEPSAWHYPVRLLLGAVLLDAGHAAEAEAIYREDLAIYPENGYALYGLAASLRAQGRHAEAEAAEARFETAWQYADITLAASRL